MYNSSAIPLVTFVSDNEIAPESSSEEEHARETFSDYLTSIFKPVYNKLLLLYYQEIMSLIIWIEFYTVATGDHFGRLNSNVNTSTDRELHITAMAITEFWLKLPTLEKTHIALAEATMEVAELVGGTIMNGEPVQTSADDILPLVLKTVEAKLQNDVDLYRKYEQVKSNIAKERLNVTCMHRTYFRKSRMSRRNEMHLFKEWFSHPKIRNFILHKVFVHQYLKPVPLKDSEEYESTVTAKAIVQLSKIHNVTDKVNKIYNDTVFEITSQFTPSNFPLGTNTTALGGFNPQMYVNKTVPLLFEKLEKKFKENPLLYLELLTVKKSVEQLAISHPIIFNGSV